MINGKAREGGENLQGKGRRDAMRMVGGKEAKWRKRKKIVLLLLILLSLATALSVIACKCIEFVEYIM